MGLDFVQLEFFTYGLAGALATYSIFPILGVFAIFWFGAVFMGVHLEDSLLGIIHFHTWPFISLMSGTAVGLSLAWLLRLPVLLDTSIRNTRNRKRNWAPEFSVLVLASTLLLLAFYYLTGALSDGSAELTADMARILGWIFLVAGGALAIFWFWYSFWSKTDRFNKVMNGKYALMVAVMMATAPSFYDYMYLLGISPWHGPITLAAIALQWVAIYLHLGYIYFHCNKHGKKWQPACAPNGFFDERHRNPSCDTTDIDRLMSFRQLRLLVVLGGVTQFVVYVIGWLVDIYTGSEVQPVVIAIAATSLLFVIIFVIAGNSKNVLKYLFVDTTEAKASDSFRIHRKMNPDVVQKLKGHAEVVRHWDNQIGRTSENFMAMCDPNLHLSLTQSIGTNGYAVIRKQLEEEGLYLDEWHVISDINDDDDTDFRNIRFGIRFKD